MNSFNLGDPTRNPPLGATLGEEIAPEKNQRSRPTIVDLLALAQRLTLSRERRGRYLSPELFGEPGWDMMIALFSSDAEGRRMTVTNLSEASGVPNTTALRWIEKLVELGLAKREKNLLDARVVFLELQPSGKAAMLDYLSQIWTLCCRRDPEL